MQQVLNVYKPKGMTSFDVVASIRRKLGVKKVGHAGTLDPLAEGVLLVLVGDATKRQAEFMGLQKEYIAELALGFDTETYDLEGKVVVKADPDLLERFKSKEPKEKIKECLSSFIGEVFQTVPAFSAVKVSGNRLYKLARSKKVNEIKLPVKKIIIHSIELLEFLPEGFSFADNTVPLVKLKISCGSGTYIRSLAHDIGLSLKTCATMTSLVRTRIGDFKSEESVALADVI